MNMQETALFLIKLAASLFPPLAAILAQAMAAHTPAPGASAGEIRLADKIRGVLPEISAARRAVEQIERDEMIPIVTPGGTVADVGEEGDNPNPEMVDPVPDIPSSEGSTS